MFLTVPYLILRRLRARCERFDEEVRYQPPPRPYRQSNNNINRRQFLRRRRRRRIFPVRINLSEIDEHDIQERYRLNSDAIMSLYDLIKKDLISTTKRSNAVPGIVKLLCALHYFTSGSLQSTVAEAGGITQSTFSRALSEVISAILKLADQFVKFPSDTSALQLIKQGFHSIDGFPDILGAVGCTHIAISPPSEMEQMYRNKKHYHSINVQVICDADMRILDVVSQCPGSTSDSAILKQSAVHERFENGEFNGWLLGDAGYRVKPWLLTPFENPATESEVRYNVSHSAAYSVVERTIDVLKSRFRCLDNPNGVLLYNPEKVSLWLRHIIVSSRTSLCLRSVSSAPNVGQELLDLGFSEEQAEKIQSMRCPTHKTPNVKELCLIGLSHKTVLRLLEERPDLLRITVKELRDRVDALRGLGLGEGSLQNSLSGCPALLSVPRSRLQAATQCLKSRCHFTSQQVLKILHTAPETLTQDPSHLEDVFQYVYFRMGGKHGEIVSSQVFQTAVEEIRVRHQFLERLGKFQPPNKKMVCPPSNPKLKEVFQLSEEDFLSQVARSSSEELGTFRKILEREERESEQLMEDELSEDEKDDEQDSDSEDHSEDEDYEKNVHEDKPNHRHKKKK